MNTRRAVLNIAESKKSIVSLSAIPRSTRFLGLSRDGFARVWDSQVESGIATSTMQCGSEHFCNSSSDRSGIDENILITPSRNEHQVECGCQ